MGWDGGGSITWPYDWTDDRDAGGASAIISATKFDAQWADAASAIEACLNRNGENAMAADLAMGANQITGLGDPGAATDAANASSVAENTVQYGGTTGGSSNAYTVTNSFIATVGTGTRLLCLANHTNSGAATMNVNSGGATAIVAPDGSTALQAGEIVSGDFFEVAYDGTSWVLINSPLSQSGTFTDGTVVIGVNDSVPGAITIYGGGTGELGGSISVYNNADDDGTVEYWSIRANDGNGNFDIGRPGSTDFVIQTDGNHVLAGSSGVVVVGANDSVPAQLVLYGGGTGEAGSILDLYNAADDDSNTSFWRVTAETSTGNLVISQDGSAAAFFIDDSTLDINIPNALGVTGATTLSSTLEVTGAITATDLTSGGVIKADTSGVLSEGFVRASASATGTGVSFTSIPAWAEMIIIHITSISVNTSGANDGVLLLQLGDSGGIEGSGYASAASQGANNTARTDGLALTHATFADSQNGHGSVILSKATSNGVGWTVHGCINVGGAVHVSGGEKSLSAALDRIQLLWVGGAYTFDSGTFYIEYI